MIKWSRLIGRIFGNDALRQTPPGGAGKSISSDPFWPRACGIKDGDSFRLFLIDPRTPEELAESEERAWIDDAMLVDEITADCAAEIGASPVAQI